MYKMMFTALACTILIAGSSNASDGQANSCAMSCKDKYDADMQKLAQELEGAISINKITQLLEPSIAAKIKSDLEMGKKKKEEALQTVLDECTSSCG